MAVNIDWFYQEFVKLQQQNVAIWEVQQRFNEKIEDIVKGLGNTVGLQSTQMNQQFLDVLKEIQKELESLNQRVEALEKIVGDVSPLPHRNIADLFQWYDDMQGQGLLSRKTVVEMKKDAGKKQEPSTEDVRAGEARQDQQGQAQRVHRQRKLQGPAGSGGQEVG